MALHHPGLARGPDEAAFTSTLPSKPEDAQPISPFPLGGSGKPWRVSGEGCVGGGAHHAQEVILANHVPVPELHPQRGWGTWHLPQLQHLIPVWEASLLDGLGEEGVRERANGTTVPILQMVKLRFREVKWLSQGHLMPHSPGSSTPLTEVSKLWLPQNTRANGSDVPEMSRGARSLGTDEVRGGGSQDP